MIAPAITPAPTAIRKVGRLRSWHPQRAFGIIKVGPESSLERYWLHVTAICSGTACPSVGMSVEFEPGPPRVQGDLAPALKADVIVPVKESPTTDATTD